MPNSPNNEVKSTFNPIDVMEKEWRIKFNELCYEVFYKHSFGQQLLSHMENKYFRSPVAFPNRDPSWAFFNEGQNEIIRSFTAGIQGHLAYSSVKEKVAKKVQSGVISKGRQRNPKIRPI